MRKHYNVSELQLGPWVFGQQHNPRSSASALHPRGFQIWQSTCDWSADFQLQFKDFSKSIALNDQELQIFLDYSMAILSALIQNAAKQFKIQHDFPLLSTEMLVYLVIFKPLKC